MFLEGRRSWFGMGSDTLYAYDPDSGQLGSAGAEAVARSKPDVTAGFSYRVHNPRVAELLSTITGRTLEWARGRTGTAWISLDEGDDDPARLAAELAALPKPQSGITFPTIFASNPAWP